MTTDNETPEKPLETVASAGEVSEVPEPKKASAKSAKVEEIPATSTTEGDEPQFSPEQMQLPWYVIHTYSGFENRAKLSLEERVRTAGLENEFGRILVPQENVVEMVKGQKRTSSRKFFPGYMLVQMDLNDETWHLVKDTPKVSGFIGDSRNPSPLTAEEVSSLMQQLEGGGQRPRPKVEFESGDPVKVIDGPFVDFNGTVDEVRPDKGKLRVLISIFGRNTPVELDFIQVEKV